MINKTSIQKLPRKPAWHWYIKFINNEVCL